MRRRSLFGALFGLARADRAVSAAAAPKVVEDITVDRAAGLVQIGDPAGPLRYGSVAGLPATWKPVNSARLHYQVHDGQEVILPLKRGPAGRLGIGKPGDTSASIFNAVQPLPKPASGPIGIAWSGYDDAAAQGATA